MLKLPLNSSISKVIMYSIMNPEHLETAEIGGEMYEWKAIFESIDGATIG